LEACGIDAGVMSNKEHIVSTQRRMVDAADGTKWGLRGRLGQCRSLGGAQFRVLF
jgi:hypothetical protein